MRVLSWLGIQLTKIIFIFFFFILFYAYSNTELFYRYLLASCNSFNPKNWGFSGFFLDVGQIINPSKIISISNYVLCDHANFYIQRINITC